MKLVGDFLARFNSITPPDDAIKTVLIEALQHTLSTTVSKKAIRVQNGTAFVSGSSILKNALRVKRGEVLEYVYGRLPKARETVRDVR